MDLPPFLLEDWLLRCRGAKIVMDHSGAPPPYKEGFPADIDIGTVDEAELEGRLIETIARSEGVGRERVALSSGAQNANFLAFQALLSPDDMVAVENPTYMPIRTVSEGMCRIEAFGRVATRDFVPDNRELEAVLRKGANLLVLTNLHNPSASSLSDSQLKEVMDIASDKEAMVLCDEIYREMHYSSPPKPVALLRDNGISTSGVTKLYGLGDLRIGWVIGPEELCSRIELLRLYSMYRLPVRSIALAIEALKRTEWFRGRVLDLARGNLRIVEEWLEVETRVRCKLPDGGLMVLLSLPEGVDDLRLSEILMDHFSTSVCPGRYFGIDNHIRVTFSCATDEFRKGLENISKVLDSLSA